MNFLKQAEYMLISLKRDFLLENDLPDIEYPVPIALISEILKSEKTDIPTMLFWLQEYSATLKNNWEYAVDFASYEPAATYAQTNGASYFICWGKGLGVSHDGQVDPVLKKYYNMKPLMPNIVAAQIGNYYRHMPQDLFAQIFQP